MDLFLSFQFGFLFTLNKYFQTAFMTFYLDNLDSWQTTLKLIFYLQKEANIRN